MNNLRNVGVALSLALAIVSCNRDEETITEASNVGYDKGILVFNEGNYGTPNAEVSFIVNDFSKIENGLYENVNKEKLGDVLNGVAFKGDNMYMVMNNSNKLTVANRYTLKKVAEITEGIHQPRYVTFSGKYLYVTSTDFFNPSKNGVSIYDETYKFIKKIPFKEHCDRIVSVGNSVFVQNASFGSGNHMTIISNETNEIQSTLEVPKGNIQKTITHNNSVYVMTSSDKDENSYIYQYSPDGTLTRTIELKDIVNAKNLVIDQDKIYFTAGAGVYTMGLKGKNMPTKPFINVKDYIWSLFYGFNVIDGFVYISDAKGYTELSEITVYTNTGKLVKTFKAGIGTNAFYKN